MKEIPGDGQSAGGWEYWIKLENNENYLLGGLVKTYIFN